MHNLYDWVKDIGLPLLTGGGSVVIGVAALRVARRGHELASAAEEREERSGRFEARQRVAVELLDLVRVREWDLTEPQSLPTHFGVPEIRPGTAAHMNDRDEADIISAASTFAGSLSASDRLGLDWLLNLIQELLRPANRGHIPLMATTTKLMIERWTTEPQAFLERARAEWPHLDPS
ncbi:hypothetical protein [Curtobacterium sp. AB7]|uniref:hypothetical protein n=1 Tax=Curtobacterium sp. AB7 TaxID=3349327 RepID=UPI0038346A0A